MSYYAQLVAAYEADDGSLLRANLITSTIGFLQYFYCIYLTHKDGKGPFPLWMHLFYLAHDSVFAYILAEEAPKYNNHPYFTKMAKGLTVWSVLEVYCIYRAVVYEREGLFSDGDNSNSSSKKNLKNNVSRGKAFVHSLLLLLVFYGLVLSLIYMVGRECFPHWTLFTKMLMVVGPGSLWLERGSRRGTSLGLAALAVVDAVLSFYPYSRWVLIWPEVFDNPIYYFTGVSCTLAALFNLYVVASFPPKA